MFGLSGDLSPLVWLVLGVVVVATARGRPRVLALIASALNLVTGLAERLIVVPVANADFRAGNQTTTHWIVTVGDWAILGSFLVGAGLLTAAVVASTRPPRSVPVEGGAA